MHTTLRSAISDLHFCFGVQKNRGNIPPRQAFYCVLETRGQGRKYRVRLCNAQGEKTPHQRVGVVNFTCRVTLVPGTVYGRNGHVISYPSHCAKCSHPPHAEKTCECGCKCSNSTTRLSRNFEPFQPGERYILAHMAELTERQPGGWAASDGERVGVGETRESAELALFDKRGEQGLNGPMEAKKVYFMELPLTPPTIPMMEDDVEDDGTGHEAEVNPVTREPIPKPKSAQ